MMNFSEFVRIKEGLWLNDKNAVVGLSRMKPPAPLPKQSSVPNRRLKSLLPTADATTLPLSLQHNRGRALPPSGR